jgi:hypothetical protein
MSWLNWPPWQARIQKQAEAERIKRESEQHEAILTAINGITHELRSGHLQRDKTESAKESREWVASIGLLITAGAAVIGLILNVVQIHRARDALLLDQRAWVGIKNVVVTSVVAVGKPMVIDIGYTNSGKTPAVALELINCTTGDTEEKMIEWKCSSGNLAIAPNQELAITNTSTPLLQTYVDQLKGGTKMYFRGVFQYNDIFGITHHTGFCTYFTGIENIKFVACPNGNYMD